MGMVVQSDAVDGDVFVRERCEKLGVYGQCRFWFEVVGVEYSRHGHFVTLGLFGEIFEGGEAFDLCAGWWWPVGIGP